MLTTGVLGARSDARRLVVVIDMQFQVVAREENRDPFFDAYVADEGLTPFVMRFVSQWRGEDAVSASLDDACVVHRLPMPLGRRRLTALIFEQVRTRRRSRANLRLVSKR